MFADENIIDYEEIPAEMAKNDDYFALKFMVIAWNQEFVTMMSL